MEEAQLTRVTVARKEERQRRETRVEYLSTRVPQANPSQLLGQFANYTPLKMNKARAMEICEQMNLIQRPPGSTKGPRGMPSDKYCEFHNDYGHTLEECRHLTEEIERVFRQNSGMKAILSRDDYRPPKRARDDKNWHNGKPTPDRPRSGPQNFTPNIARIPAQTSPRGIINIISGGPTDGDSNLARKTSMINMSSLEIRERKVQSGPIISFGSEDMQGVDDPHNDALVIRAMVSNYEVARIFVDSGSSVNVLFKETMEQMELGEYKVEPMVTALFGFTGHSVDHVGMINLLLSLGEGELRKTRIFNFVVIEALSAYNIILGRPAMAIFAAVSSALHQKLKFPIRNQVGEVKGDQEVDRKCYVQEVRMEQKVAKSFKSEQDKPGGVDHVHFIDKTVLITPEEECEKIICEPDLKGSDPK